jgi:hypothetical protein
MMRYGTCVADSADARTRRPTVSMFSVGMDGVLLTPRSAGRYFNAAR